MIAIPAILTLIIMAPPVLIDMIHYEENDPLSWWFLPIFSTLIITVFIISRVLSKFLFKNILISLDVLATGVEEISEGNLDYTIEQNMGNEFDAISRNFNEMATRLSQMVKAQQTDEQSRKELIAGISHDLRTPLTSIKIYLEGLKKGVATTPKMQEKYLNIIEEKADHMEYIINQLFQFSQMDIGEFPLKMETVDIGNELEKLIIRLSDEFSDKGLAVSLLENVQGVFVFMDVIQFKNVMENLLNNSLKYGKKENGQVDIRCLKENEKVIIKVTDNGDGVPEDMLTQIFDVFYRNDKSRNSAVKGSGLGLAISSKIIHRFNGTIEAENTINGGLCIIITLPMIEGE